MRDFTGVGKQALSYRLLPRVIGIFFMSLLLGGISFTSLGFLKVPNFTLISVLIGLGFFIILSLIVYLLAYLEYSNLKYLVEENSLLLKEGVFNVDQETIPFQKIRNASFKQNIIQRLYGVGDIIIDQDPETYIWEAIDNHSAQIIIEAVSEKSNIQPIAVAPNQPNPYMPK